MDDQKLKKLPKWAQLEISRLKRDLQSKKNELSELYGNTETNILLIDLLNERPLPKNSTIRFLLGDDKNNNIDVNIIDGNVRVSSYRQIKVLPRATNTIEIATRAS